MKNRTKSVLVCFLFIAMGFAAIANADDEKPEYVVFPIQHIEAKTIVRIAQSVLDSTEFFRLEMDDATNSVIFLGKKAQLENLEELIKKTDVSPTTEQPVIKAYSLRHSDSNEVLPLLEMLTGAKDGKVDRPGPKWSADARTNSIIVLAANDVHKVIERLLMEIDRPREARNVAAGEVENCIVRITWLVDSEDGRENAFRKPNVRLSRLVEGLKTEGLMSQPAELLTMQSAVRAATVSQAKGTEFTCSSIRTVAGMDFAVQGKGSLRKASNGKFDVNLDLTLEKSGIPLKIGTRINIPKSHPVAFSLSELGTLKMAAVVEILESGTGR